MQNTLRHKDPFHGSDLEKIEQIYGIKKEDIISFSANINPLGISGHLRSSLAARLDAITAYPDREYKALRSCLAVYADTRVENIIVGNGSTELISLFIQTYHPKKAMILGPTYSEYEREITLGGGTTLYYPLKEELNFCMNVDDFCHNLHEGLDLLVLCNPNNPTSTAISARYMRQILDASLQYGIFVMVDETYVEFTDQADHISSIPLTDDYTNLIILRGTSKFFASPGLRLGYAVTGNQDLIQQINTRQNPWSINALAEIAGRLMFQDRLYAQKTQNLIAGESARLYGLLSSWDAVKVYKPAANFILIRILKEGADAEALFNHCIRKRLMIRNCSSFPFLDNSFVRFCIMLPEQNNKLMEAFREILG